MHGEALLARDDDLAPQPIERQPPGKVVSRRGFAIDQHIIAVGPEDEVEQRLALRRQQPGPERKIGREPGHVVRDEPLQEAADIFAGKSEQGAVGEGGGGHEQELGVLSQIANSAFPSSR